MLTPIDIAKAHLRIDGLAEDTILAVYINAAEQSVAQHINRRLYADKPALTAAKAAAPTALTAATADYTAAKTAAYLLTDHAEQCAAMEAAHSDYLAAKNDYRETVRGIVINDQITSAVLLTLGDLYASREDTVIGASVAALPQGARFLMQPYRIGMGV